MMLMVSGLQSRHQGRIVFGMNPNECEIWTGGMEAGRPGRIRRKGKRYEPHRLKWAEINGPIPEGMALLRTCENILCMNLAHMKLGTIGESVAGAESNWKATGKLKQKGLAKFAARVKKHAQTECWIWAGGLDRDGYGKVCIGRKTVLSHQVAWIIENGPVPDGKWVLHTCDNRRCCNPAHLYLGNPQTNMDDKMNRDRWRGGHPGGSREKLTEVQVLEIRRRHQAGERKRTMAKEYRVSAMTLHAIITRRTWRHLGSPEEVEPRGRAPSRALSL